MYLIVELKISKFNKSKAAPSFTIKRAISKYKLKEDEIIQFKKTCTKDGKLIYDDFKPIKARVRVGDVYLNTQITSKYKLLKDSKPGERIRKTLKKQKEESEEPLDINYDDFELLSSNIDKQNDFYQQNGFYYKTAEDIVNESDLDSKDKVILYNIVNSIERYAISNVIQGKAVSIPYLGTIGVSWQYFAIKDNKELLDEYKKDHTEEEYKEYRKIILGAAYEKHLEEESRIILSRSVKMNALNLNYAKAISSVPYRNFNRYVFSNIKIQEHNKDEDLWLENQN